jgi:hypothetical protein
MLTEAAQYGTLGVIMLQQISTPEGEAHTST